MTQHEIRFGNNVWAGPYRVDLAHVMASPLTLEKGGSMSSYVLAQLTIHDRARYDRYAAQFMDVLSRFEGRLLAADESPELLEGDWPHQKVVLIEFKDRDEAARWAASPEYRKIAIDREGSTIATVLSVRGLHPWSSR